MTPRTAPAEQPFHVGLTPERVVDAALALTAERGLQGWSVRDLAQALGVSPSGVYHHVGGRELVARHVVERVLLPLHGPGADVPWQEWFARVLADGYEILTPYRGVARWLIMHGPVFPTVIPLVEEGLEVLSRGGFGNRAPLAYAQLLNGAMMSIAAGDDRHSHEEDDPRDHASLMREMLAAADGTPGVQRMAQEFIGPFARSPEEAARQRRAYYDAVCRTTIAGLAALS